MTGREQMQQTQGRFEIDDQLNFHRLLARRLAGLFTLGNAAGVSADQAICVGETGTMAHQATC
jgi:hypothetical protein